VSKFRIYLIPLALVLTLGASVASANTLLVQRVERAKASALPRKGSTMVEVESQYGAPDQKLAAVGKPPITRWQYAAFTVYFEYDHVINAVVNKSSAEEKGPMPVAARQSRE
jgi:hypothetical protein